MCLQSFPHSVAKGPSGAALTYSLAPRQPPPGTGRFADEWRGPGYGHQGEYGPTTPQPPPLCTVPNFAGALLLGAKGQPPVFPEGLALLSSLSEAHKSVACLLWARWERPPGPALTAPVNSHMRAPLSWRGQARRLSPRETGFP